MELTRWIDTLMQELPALPDCLINNAYPVSFLCNALGFNETLVARLSQYLTAFIGLYLLCGVITIALRFKRGQKSLNGTARQITHAILTCCCTLFVPALILLAKACVYVLKMRFRPFRAAAISSGSRATASAVSSIC